MCDETLKLTSHTTIMADELTALLLVILTSPIGALTGRSVGVDACR